LPKPPARETKTTSQSDAQPDNQYHWPDNQPGKAPALKLPGTDNDMAAEKVKVKQTKTLNEPTARQSAIIATASQHPYLSERKIAAITNTDPAQVHRTLKAFGIKTELTDDYVNHRAKIYQGLQAKIISSISAEDIQKAGLRDKCVAMGIIHDHERIELGQSTDKQPVLVLVRGDNCQVSINDNQINKLSNASTKIVGNTGMPTDKQVIDITPNNDNDSNAIPAIIHT